MKHERIKNDKYNTESKLTQVLLDNVDIYGQILEPCAGGRDIARYLDDNSPMFGDKGRFVFSSDLTDETKEYAPLDATTKDFWEFYSQKNTVGFSTQWTVTNPPFKLAPKIIPLAYEYSSRGIAMLLRLTYLEPCSNRAEWLAEHADQLRCVIPVNPRPKFRADTKGTDSCTVAWFVWDKQHSWKAHGLDCPFVFAAGWNN